MRERILNEIRRLAAASGGQPPGMNAFRRETGIREAVWRGVHWARWSDALVEAGFAPNEYQSKFHSDFVFRKFVEVARHFGHLPTFAELRMYRISHADFPNESTFHNHVGNKQQLLAALRDWVTNKPEFEDIVKMYGPERAEAESTPVAKEGLVYLIKSGDHYKIGRTDDFDRRVREIKLALPEAVTWLHSIRTDDPSGIEAYWHNRFSDRRANGEWFRLSYADVLAFKRRKYQ